MNLWQRLLLFALTLIVSPIATVVPVRAAITSIGSLGTATATNTAQNSLALTTSAQLDVGNYGACVHVHDSSDNTEGYRGRMSAFVDSVGNIWEFVREFNIDGDDSVTQSTGAVFMTKATVDLPSSGTITAHHSSADARAMTCWEFSVGSGNYLRVAGFVTDIEANSADPASMTIDNLLSAEYLFLRAIGSSGNGGAITPTTNFTAFSVANANTGTANTSRQAFAEFRIVTATSQASDPTVESATSVSMYLAFVEGTPRVFPTILANSSTGSDSNASGAGPATAVTNGSCQSSADGFSVTLSGSDLSGVASDGSAALFFNDTTADFRNFVMITSVDDANDVVRVELPLQTSQTKACAIGGKRLTISSTSSQSLFAMSGTLSDLQPGWTLELESGFTDTFAGAVSWRTGGNQMIGGWVTMRATPGAATRPLVTFSNNGTGFSLAGSLLWFEGIEFQNTNGTKTASTIFTQGSVSRLLFKNIKAAHATNKFAIPFNSIFTGAMIVDSEISCAVACIQTTIPTPGRIFANNYIHDCAIGINLASGVEAVITGNIITGCTGVGIQITPTTSGSAGFTIVGNTINGNAGGGVQLSGPNAYPVLMLGGFLVNNIISNNTGYGLTVDSKLHYTATEGVLPWIIRGNNFYNNSSGAYYPTQIPSFDEQTLDPQFVNAAGGDFRIQNAALRAKGYPVGGSLAIGTGSSTYNYIDPGAAQRQDSRPGPNIGAGF